MSFIKENKIIWMWNKKGQQNMLNIESFVQKLNYIV